MKKPFAVLATLAIFIAVSAQTVQYNLQPSQDLITAAVETRAIANVKAAGQRYINLGGYALGDASNQLTVLQTAQTAWNNAGTTTSGTQNPPASARALFIPSGNYAITAGAISLQTPGTGSVITGFGENSRLSGDISILINQFRSSASGFLLTGTGTYGVLKQNEDRRNATIANFRIRDKGVGLQHEAGGRDTTISGFLEGNTVGARFLDDAFGSDHASIQVLNSTASGVDMIGGSEIRWFNSRIQNSAGAGIWIKGSSESQAVENYFLGNSVSTGLRELRRFTILAADNNGGNVRLKVTNKIATTVTDAGGVFTQGAAAVSGLPVRPARVLINVGTQSSGSLDSLTVNGTALISAPVAAVGSANETNVMNAINNGGSGYTAAIHVGQLYVYAPSADGASANGRVITPVTSGALTVTVTNFVKFTWASAHGLSAGTQLVTSDDFKHDSGCVGTLAVRYVESATVLYSDQPSGQCTNGNSWRIFRMTPGTGGGLITNVGGSNNGTDVTAVSVEDEYITTDIAWPGSWTIGASASIAWQNWDMIVECLDTASSRVNDLYIIGGNMNNVLVKCGLNITFTGVRNKEMLWVDYRANASYRSNRICRVNPSARGRQDPTFGDVPISGTNTGVCEMVGLDPVGTGAPGTGEMAIRLPCKTIALSQNLPTWNYVKVTEALVEVRSCNQTLTLNEAMIAKLNALP